MDGFNKNDHSSEVAEHSAPSQHHEEKKEAPVISPRRLRDRELLKRKKEESREKDTYFEQTQTKSKRPRQTRATGSRRRKQVKEPEPQLEPEPEPKNEPNHEHDQATEPQHEPEPNIEPDHKDEQATEPQHKPESKNDPDHKHEQAIESLYEFEPENKLWIGHDVQQEFSQQEQEPLQHHESPVITIIEDERADETYAVHEEADGHYQQDLTTLIRDKEEQAVVEPEHHDSPEVLSFALQEQSTPEQEEHQYYTPLL